MRLGWPYPVRGGPVAEFWCGVAGCRALRVAQGPACRWRVVWARVCFTVTCPRLLRGATLVSRRAPRGPVCVAGGDLTHGSRLLRSTPVPVLKVLAKPSRPPGLVWKSSGARHSSSAMAVGLATTMRTLTAFGLPPSREARCSSKSGGPLCGVRIRVPSGTEC